jgi:hypothetical protein
MRYEIDYEHGKAILYTPSQDWRGTFRRLANQCFGIRKSIGDVVLLDIADIEPNDKMLDEYERLKHNGDIIIWNKEGEKIKAEWEEMPDAFVPEEVYTHDFEYDFEALREYEYQQEMREDAFGKKGDF